ncbi:MAG: glycoside hydrolase family 15 protein [Candidatus Omnitrophota bacterium]
MFKKIGDYGLIGNMHSLALVSCDGSIDYCAMPHINSPTVFAALLDDEKGGYFFIRPRGEFFSCQAYIPETNILVSGFKNAAGEGQLVDFMPVSSRQLVGDGEHIIHRCLKVTSGNMEFVAECVPRPDYARQRPNIIRRGNGFLIRAGKELFSLGFKARDCELLPSDDKIIIRFRLGCGQEAYFDFAYGRRRGDEGVGCGLAETRRFWQGWLGKRMGRMQGEGEYSQMVDRSFLALKLLTFQPSGAIAAAATTSLPEHIGGGRNWDYRFAWIRDASWTLKALFSRGYVFEADSFVRWLHRTYERHGGKSLQVMYGLDGEQTLPETELGHLKGYRGSRPVRIGNGAYGQDQWDIYGEIMDTALRLSDYAGRIDPDLWPFLRSVCNLALKNWRRPDYGIWEVRGGPRHFVYSKVMCWVALDRGIKIARRFGFDAPLGGWEREAAEIKQDVLDNGYDFALKSFVQYYGSRDLDASLLLLPLVGFLSIADPRIKNTIAACRDNLMRAGFLRRYLSSDGLDKGEGGFVLCNFWLVECLALSGAKNEARKVLARTIKAANPLGLFAEEYDAQKGQLLGNFPQALSHIGFINAVSAIVADASAGNRWPGRWLRVFKKLTAARIILNGDGGVGQGNGSLGQEAGGIRPTADALDIAARLKAVLNNLQGGYFDVRAGRVDYDSLRRSGHYRDYVSLAKRLAGFDLFRLTTDREKKAFWINVYNILVIHGVVELEIKKSVKEILHFFRRIGYNIGGYYWTPDDIEHGILRLNRPRPGGQGRQFSPGDKRQELALARFDPRIHFSLVCAASSCPPIEFYSPRGIEEQLEISGRSFVNRRGLVLDKEKGLVYLSQIFKWYRRDFGRGETDALNFALGYTQRQKADYIRRNLSKLKIRYLLYDWNLNSEAK